MDAAHHAAVFQGHPLEQAVVHVVADADGEDAELLLHRRLGVAQDVGGFQLAHCWPAIGEEDDERHAVVVAPRAEEVIA